MSDKTSFDVEAAHRHFSAYCFNRAWDLIEKPDRTPQEDEEMLRLSQASHWHWTQREDYGPQQASIAWWQLSRIYALLGQPESARRYGQLCLEASQDESVGPFYLGYAYEALARAEAVAGNGEKAQAYREAARQAAAQVDDDADRQLLLAVWKPSEYDPITRLSPGWKLFIRKRTARNRSRRPAVGACS